MYIVATPKQRKIPFGSPNKKLKLSIHKGFGAKNQKISKCGENRKKCSHTGRLFYDKVWYLK
jgi:hypothetical protein